MDDGELSEFERHKRAAQERTPDEWVERNRELGKRSGQRAHERKLEKQAEFLVCLGNGSTIGDACVTVGISRRTYQNWRDDDPVWAGRADQARADGGGQTRLDHEDEVLAFAAFRKQMLRTDSPAFHLQAVRAFSDAEPGSITLLLWPPEHGKTTTLEDFATHQLCVNPEVRIGVASENQNHPRKMLRRVKNRLEPHGPFPQLVKRYGPFVPQTKEDDDYETGHVYQPWGADYFDVFKKSSHDERDYSMIGLGINSSVVGSRLDYLFIDDVQSRKTLALTDKLVDVFRQDWLTRPGPLGRTFIVGTRVGRGDFYEKLIEEGLIDNLIVFPAHNLDGEWLWPERYTEDQYLRMKRNAGPDGWARNYMQRPEALGSTHFPEDVLDHCSDPGLAVWMDPPEDAVQVAIAVDPGFGVNVTMAAAFCPNRMVILDAVESKGLRSNQEIIGVAEETMLAHVTPTVRCHDWIIEDKAFQKGLFHDEALLAVRNRYGVNVSGHQTGSNKHDPNIGVAAMPRAMQRREIILPGADDPATRRFREELDGQLRAWRPDRRGNRLKQDMVMTLWFLWLLWRRRRESITVGPSTWNTDGVAWSPTRPQLIIPVGAWAGR